MERAPVDRAGQRADVFGEQMLAIRRQWRQRFGRYGLGSRLRLDGSSLSSRLLSCRRGRYQVGGNPLEQRRLGSDIDRRLRRHHCGRYRRRRCCRWKRGSYRSRRLRRLLRHGCSNGNHLRSGGRPHRRCLYGCIRRVSDGLLRAGDDLCRRCGRAVRLTTGVP